MILGEHVESGKQLKMDVPRLLESRLLIQANSGGGKSWILRRLLEQTHGHVPHLVLDIEDEFHTLREKYPYVLAGPTAGADIAVDAKLAPLLVRRILEHGFSTIVSIYEMKKHQRMHFVRVLLEHLVEAPRALWRPLLVVVDEAHLFCPEKGESEASTAVIDLMTRGRKRGFCGVLATQRISKLHKDAAAEANNKLIGRAALDIDMKRAADELGFTGREEQQRLRHLKPGQFFAFGPAISPTIELIKSGGVNTTHPEPGARGNIAPPPPPEKIKVILAKLIDLPKEQAAQEDEVTKLRREVSDLRKTRAATPAPTAAPQPDVAARDGLKAAKAIAQGVQRELVHISERFDREVGKFTADIQRTQADFATRLNDCHTRLEGVLSPAPTSTLERHGIPALQQQVNRAASSALAHVTNPGDKALGNSGKRRMLIALAQHGTLTTSKLALLTGISSKGGTWRTYMGELRSGGLVEGGRDALSITPAGTQALGHYEPLPTGDALRDYWRGRLGDSGKRRIFDVLVEAYPQALTKEDVGQRTGIEIGGGTWRTYIGELRSLELVEGSGALKASDVLF